MKACIICGQPFEPKFTSMQIVCGIKCARRVPVVDRKKAACDRRETKARLAVMTETLPVLRERAQKEFNLYIRLRDAALPCVCCGGRPKPWESLTGGVWDAGHFRGRGANPELAFDEDNCHKQLKACNRSDWDRVAYENELLTRIGPERLAILKGPHPPKHYTRDDFRALTALYRAKVKALA